MSGIHNKNLLFFSLHPNDAISRECLQQIQKNKELDKQFIKICVHDPSDITKPPKITLPKVVHTCLQNGKIPILAIAGFQEPVFAKHALSWIKETSLNKRDVMASNIDGNGVADSCCTVEQSGQSGNTLFDSEYNIGFSDGRGEFNKGYASIEESSANRIVTYDETSDKKQAASDIAKRLEQMKFARDQDVPKQPGRAGGGQQPQFPSMPQQQQRSPMQYNPNVPSMPQQQRPPMQYNPNVPMQQPSQMPSMPSFPPQQPQFPSMQYNPNVPMMPQHQQQHSQMPTMPSYPPQQPQFQNPGMPRFNPNTQFTQSTRSGGGMY